VLRVPMAILQLSGVLSASAPAWYVVFQDSSEWPSSASGSPCWPATGAQASGEPI